MLTVNVVDSHYSIRKKNDLFKIAYFRCMFFFSLWQWIVFLKFIGLNIKFNIAKIICSLLAFLLIVFRFITKYDFYQIYLNGELITCLSQHITFFTGTSHVDFATFFILIYTFVTWLFRTLVTVAFSCRENWPDDTSWRKERRWDR